MSFNLDLQYLIDFYSKRNLDLYIKIYQIGFGRYSLRNNKKEVKCFADISDIKKSKFQIVKIPKPIDSYPIRVNIDTVHFNSYFGKYYKELLKKSAIPNWVIEYLLNKN